MFPAQKSYVRTRSPSAALRGDATHRTNGYVIQKAHQFHQCRFVDTALEFNHGIQRRPVLAPAPGIEFGMTGAAQAHIGVAAGQPQEEPDLLLALVSTAPFAPYPIGRYIVSHPVPRAADDLDMLRLKSHFFHQLAKHRLLRRFTLFDATLRKLPRMLAHALTPEHLILAIDDNDADIRTIPVSVEHKLTLQFFWRGPARRTDYPE